MEAKYSLYDHTKSIERIDNIIDSSDANYEDKSSIPKRDNLTFSNGYYVYASSIFVDIRDSKSLNAKHKRPTLAKIYRTYISEVIAVMTGNTNVNEVYIEGDGVWGIFDTPTKPDIDSVFSTSAQISSIIDILNIKYKKKGYSELTVGIGISYNSSLYIKAGYSGSGINEVVWLGDLVSEAAKLCSYGNKSYGDKETMVSNAFYNNLNDDNKKLLEFNRNRDCYHGYIINIAMNEWVKKNG